MKFDENLRNLRKDSDFSQEYLAEKMKVSRQTISKWENGTAMPDLKKLAELAELFDVSMDELLGTSSPAPVQDNSEELEQLRNEIDKIKLSNTKYARNLSICIVVIIIGLVLISISFSNSISSLRNEMNRTNAPNQVVYQDNDEYQAMDDMTYCVSSIDKENPNIIEMTFRYAPKTYIKGTKVSFSVSHKQNSKDVAKLYDAKFDNDAFIATVKMDVADFPSVAISIDDGTSITKEDLYIDWATEYGGFTDTVVFYDKSSDVYIDFDHDSFIRWKNRADLPSIKKATVEVLDQKGNTLYSSNVKLTQDGTYTYVKPNNISLKTKPDVVRIKLKDEYDTTYSFNCVDFFEEKQPSGLQITFANGKTLETEKDVLIE